MITPSIERRSERARQAILQAAFDLCRENGFAATTMEGIAKRAGVGKQTIYRWWPSKAAVLHEALNEMAGTASGFPDTGDVYAGMIAATQSDDAVSRSFLETMIEPRVEACRERGSRSPSVSRAASRPSNVAARSYRRRSHRTGATATSCNHIADCWSPESYTECSTGNRNPAGSDCRRPNQ